MFVFRKQYTSVVQTSCYVSSFFKFYFSGHIHRSYFRGHWYPCFGFLATSPLGFLIWIAEAKCDIWSLRSTTSAMHCHPLFLKFLADTCPFLGPLVPLFWISGDVSSGFRSQSGLPYLYCRGEHNVHSLRSTSGGTLSDLLVASAQPVLSPHTVAEVRLLGFELMLSEYLWAWRSTNWAKPGPTPS